MNKLKLILISLLVLAVAPAFAQTTLTQTTLSGAVTGGSQVSLVSATNVQTAFNGQPVTYLYVDGEAMGVMSLATGTTTTFNVLRGQLGTSVTNHAANAVVYVGSVSPQFGGSIGGLELTDPPIQGNCTASATGSTPWINVTTGQQWVCAAYFTPAGNSITGWIPSSVARSPNTNVGQGIITTAAYTNATTTASAVTGLSFYAQANRDYNVTCYLSRKSSASTAGADYSFTGPSSPTAVAITAKDAVTATTVTQGVSTAFGTAVANAGTVTASTDFPDIVTLGLVNGANAGTVQLTANADGTGTATIEKGSFCIVR